ANKTFILANGTITGQASAVCNYGGKFTMNDGLVSAEYNGGIKAIYTPWDYSGSELNINGGKVSVRYTGTLSYAYIAGIYTETSNDTVNVSGGEIEVAYDSTGYSTVSGIFSYSTLNITGGHIKVTSRSTSNTFGVNSGRDGHLTIDGADVIIEAHNTESSAATDGARQEYGEAHLKKGTIISTSKNGSTLGFHNDRSTVYVEDGMSISSHSETQNAYGIWHDDWNYPGTINMTGGNISATTDASDKLGIGLISRYVTVTGGTVYGSTYGINGAIGNNNATITLGVNEPPLYNGVDEDGEGNVYPATPEIKGGVYGISDGNVYFYDGILKGGSTYVSNENIIKAIPDGTSRVVTNLSDPVEQDCWLEYDDAYLKLESNEQTYNSLTAIYADAQETDTITVIRDASTPAVLPSNTKNITFDLNGHIVNYTQPFKNDGTMTITD
ncbi:MAG: hypothetical protein U0L97_03650, partial [Candidatus Saccharimonadaceae bacterium]|nr:hypothetical protein [Candidatus Saccharimonadaceae bacterium]